MIKENLVKKQQNKLSNNTQGVYQPADYSLIRQREMKKWLGILELRRNYLERELKIINTSLAIINKQIKSHTKYCSDASGADFPRYVQANSWEPEKGFRKNRESQLY